MKVVVKVLAAPSGAANDNTLLLGNEVGGSGRYWTGDMAYVVAYADQLDASRVVALSRLLGHRFGITVA